MTEPLISVIVPVYNVEKYLDKCIESIVNQTYTNLEIILVDDGSPDNCPVICDKWAVRDSRIKVIHKDNGGVSSARNAGLDVFSGEYVAFVDSDDYIEAEFIKSLFEHLSITKSDAVISSFVFDYLDKKSDVINICDGIYDGEAVLINYLNDIIRPEACGKLISRRVINVRFDTEFGYGEDFLFNYYVLKNCKRVVCVNQHNYHYLQESGNSSTTAFITDNRARSYKEIEKILIDCKNTGGVYSAAVKRFTVRTFALLVRIMRVDEYCSKYFNDVVDCILNYKKDIILNKSIKMKYKICVIMLSLNRQFFRRICVMRYGLVD